MKISLNLYEVGETKTGAEYIEAPAGVIEAGAEIVIPAQRAGIRSAGRFKKHCDATPEILIGYVESAGRTFERDGELRQRFYFKRVR